MPPKGHFETSINNNHKGQNSLRTFRRNEVSGRTNEDNRDFLESVQSFRGVVFYNHYKAPTKTNLESNHQRLNSDPSYEKKDYLKAQQPIESMSSEESAITLTDSKPNQSSSSSGVSAGSSELSKDHKPFKPKALRGPSYNKMYLMAGNAQLITVPSKNNGLIVKTHQIQEEEKKISFQVDTSRRIPTNNQNQSESPPQLKSFKSQKHAVMQRRRSSANLERFLHTVITELHPRDNFDIVPIKEHQQTIYMRAAQHTILMATPKERAVVLQANKVKEVERELRILKDDLINNWPSRRQELYSAYPDPELSQSSPMTRTQKSLKTDMPIIVAPFKRVENFVMRRKKQNTERRAARRSGRANEQGGDPANEEFKSQGANVRLATSKIHRLNYDYGPQSPPTLLDGIAVAEHHEPPQEPVNIMEQVPFYSPTQSPEQDSTPSSRNNIQTLKEQILQQTTSQITQKSFAETVNEMNHNQTYQQKLHQKIRNFLS